MATRRSDLIDSENAGFYHLISRCVRRTFLCGFDEESGRDYEHRREWIESRILSLAKLFSIEVYGYAVMHNHKNAGSIFEQL
jgi:putative transposase